MKTNTARSLIAQFKSSHPVQQSFHTGKWGFERVADCLNLNRCVFGSKKAAEMARANDAEQFAAMSRCPKSAGEIAEEKAVQAWEEKEKAREDAINRAYANA